MYPAHSVCRWERRHTECAGYIVVWRMPTRQPCTTSVRTASRVLFRRCVVRASSQRVIRYHLTFIPRWCFGLLIWVNMVRRALAHCFTADHADGRGLAFHNLQSYPRCDSCLNSLANSGKNRPFCGIFSAFSPVFRLRRPEYGFSHGRNFAAKWRRVVFCRNLSAEKHFCDSSSRIRGWARRRNVQGSTFIEH